MVWEGFFGHLSVAVVEVAGITADDELIPSSRAPSTRASGKKRRGVSPGCAT